MKNILVLGGTGFVGAHVCEKLVQQGYHVTVPTRRRNNARYVMHLPGLTVLEANVHDEAALTRLVAGHDAVVNLIAILHGNAAAFDKVHVNLPQKLARACIANGVHRVVHISALGADDQRPGAAPSEYLRSKGRGEAVLLHPANPAEALDVTVLRPSVIFGAEDKFLNLFAKLQNVFPFMPLAGANARFQPVWVQDVAAAVVLSLQPSKPMPMPMSVSEPIQRVYELVGPDVFTLKQLVQLAARLSIGRERPVIPLPQWLGRIQAAAMELAPGEPLMSRDNLDSMQQDNVASGTLPGLRALGIDAAALAPIAAQYLTADQANAGLLAMRQVHR
ncbi:complex I NDUFA9 subunit family protein [Rhodoferax saidenbachensis]|uniref:NAD-dependent dehydratase n=1 Tax=Rhodoferax saidenbachensis TaxID=1484693 RepID=A0A1P8K7P9_9BURK|nr:complex I NDUFA9 subunit family protein [Rhodoferax saidenbachensis]APW41991.1 NAD-dependent dehydratase [Rhodoferax saidenbachensis]